ncbi:MAG: adenylate/guanylate cyclase domain-containing protein [Saprospiraceae bacterium]|nr:hypothetical protein [Lewinella sp.]
MTKNYCIYLFSLLFLLPCLLRAQEANVEIKVYDFTSGLSHRNVFKILQDEEGYMWMATINGLNRFDGYEFLTFNSTSSEHRIPHDAISDMVLDASGNLWLSHPDFLYHLPKSNLKGEEIQVKQGAIVRRESVVPYNLHFDRSGKLWMATYDESSGQTSIQVYRSDSTLHTLLEVPGQYPKRPIASWEGLIYLGAHDNHIWVLDPAGERKEEIILAGPDNEKSVIVQFQTTPDGIYALLDNGKVYVKRPTWKTFRDHPVNALIGRRSPRAGTILVDELENLWIGGRGILWFYDDLSKRLIDYDIPIRQQVKNTCTYRHLYQDRSGTIWVSSDFGAIKIVQSDRLFAQYLSGGSEYCSNVFCSTRGITEDPQGRIYISYYNSIHILDPQTNGIRPLFPSNDFFNFPYGLLYYRGSLWTGNGLRINMDDLRVDTLFQKPQQDLGVVIADRNGTLWMGFQQWLYQYNTTKDSLYLFEDSQGTWDSLAGTISYLYESPSSGDIWIGTLDAGLYRLADGKERMIHYSADVNSPARLNSNQINVIYEDSDGFYWLGTASGLHRLDPSTDELIYFGPDEGLPNHFINGILPEGDSVLWISTDNGLCRFSLSNYSCTNFTIQDGLSSNEFNRISFYKSRAGKMYFGGLNGVNAFFPSLRFLEESQSRREADLLFTGFTRLDGDSDQLYITNTGLNSHDTITLSYHDKSFSFQFALADYREPETNQYSYRLEGYEADWTPPGTVHNVRYNNLPAGKYTFRVRARSMEGQWKTEQLAIPVVIKEAYYRTWWFWSLCGALFLAALFGLERYQHYSARQREKALEKLVQERTQELEEEKQKSEELLLNILPAGLAEELKEFGFAKARRHEMVTVMFSDFKGFSRISEQLDPETLVAEIDSCFRAFDHIIEKYKLEKIKTVGDAYLCVNGINSDEDAEDAAAVISAALEMQAFLDQRAANRKSMDLHYFEARIGIHTGPVVAGIVGIKKFAYDIWGDTVNVASRMETNGEAGKINISEATYQLIRHRFRCTYHGDFQENSNSIGMYWVD